MARVGLNFNKMTKKTLLKKMYLIFCQRQQLGLTGLHEVGEGDADQKLLQY